MFICCAPANGVPRSMDAQGPSRSESDGIHISVTEPASVLPSVRPAETPNVVVCIRKCGQQIGRLDHWTRALDLIFSSPGSKLYIQPCMDAGSGPISR